MEEHFNYVDACECQAWHLKVWPPDTPEAVKIQPFKCCSWRHAGECRRWKGSQDFARIKVALQSNQDWTYMVLTFAQADWSSPFAQYKAGCSLWAKMRKRLVRKYGKPFKYVQTWERFRKGGCHVNVVVSCRNLAGAIQTDWRFERKYVLIPMAIQTGFGGRFYVESLRPNTDRMAGYLAKLSREITGTGKDYQIPVDAPAHFRRIRASARTLPPAVKSGYTGKICFSPPPTPSVKNERKGGKGVV